MARCMSSFDASATSPSGSSVAGLMFVKVPAWPSTSLPSIIILVSNRTSAMVLALLRLRVWYSHGGGRRTPKGAESWDPHHQPGHVMHGRIRQEPISDQQHARVRPDRAADERRRALQRLGESS